MSCDGKNSYMQDMVPAEIRLSQNRQRLRLIYGAKTYELEAEFLRVFSPSAEVRGHAAGQEVLQTGKRDVTITALSQVGNYALRIAFSDGHDTGLYDWDYLYDLAVRQAELWAGYEKQLLLAGASRDPD
ncbi:gamma-butyrobetaine hydroxylase-like domain-containing protein [Snodgrassella alvi]|uniref:gamma-butyrobetaine hydroxylase-like domain-containing protein n=1 Tax=Snodgrassella alvi TaxID=1196083 RepID=UPI001FD1EC97|nr:DUF971 domain-containing protein [Snodgrassella alvi]